jgi:hypothetical protein
MVLGGGIKFERHLHNTLPSPAGNVAHKRVSTANETQGKARQRTFLFGPDEHLQEADKRKQVSSSGARHHSEGQPR